MVCGTGALGRTGWLDRPLGLVDFGPACRNHDRLYAKPNGRSRHTVDSMFLLDMKTACKKSARWYKPMWLLSRFAFFYYGKVRQFGEPAWNEARRNDK